MGRGIKERSKKLNTNEGMKKESIRKGYIVFMLFSILLASLTTRAQERILVKSDRSIYFGGENIWLSVACYESNSNLASKASTVVYLDLFNVSQQSVLQKQVKLEDGIGSLFIDIPDTISTGNYMLRAYTSWMQNNNPELHSTTPLSIINPFAKNRFPEKQSLYGSDTAFIYAEGNQLLSGIENTVLVAISDRYGNGKIADGKILNSQNEIVKSFTTDLDGLAKIEFTPEPANAYQLILGKDSSTIRLPGITQKGTVLHLEETANSITQFKIRTNQKTEIPEKGSIHIHSVEGTFLLQKKTNLLNNTVVEFSGNELPKGIFCARLLNSENHILSARYFSTLDSKPENELSLKLNKTEYTEREKVELAIDATNELKHISVSVVKKGLNQKGANTQQFELNSTGINDLLLAKAPVENYQVSGKPPVHKPEPYFELIEGRLVNTSTNTAIANEKVILSFIGNRPIIEVATTDEKGNFVFEARQSHTREMVIQPMSHRSNFYPYRIELKNKEKIQLQHPFASLALSSKQMDQLNQCIINAQIVSWFSNDETTKLKADGSKPFYGEARFEVPIEKFIELPTMEEVIREIVPHTQARIKDGIYRFRISGKDVSNPDSLLVLVDGVPIWDQNRVYEVQPTDIKKIEVLHADYYVNGVNLGPILSITTNEANLSAFEFDKSIFRQVKQGLEETVEFPVVDYSDETVRSSRRPDYRNTLYWNPKVFINETEQKTILSFYTADEKSEYQVVVQGIAPSGAIVQKEVTFSVN